jgi:hypothetical protein
MAATIHVTRTYGVRFPGYSLPGPVGIPPTAGILTVFFCSRRNLQEKTMNKKIERKIERPKTTY